MSLQLAIVSGADEIGHTCIKISTASSEVVCDLGLSLKENQKKEPAKERRGEKESNRESEKEKNNPQSLQYSKVSNAEKKHRAVFISHSHMDHYGSAQNIPKEVPLYMSAGAKIIIEISNLFLQNISVDLGNVQTFQHGEIIQVGDISVTCFQVCHSAPYSFALLFESQGKRILYTGDFRSSGRQAFLFPQLLKQTPDSLDALLLEGTRINREIEHYCNELSVEKAMAELFTQQKNMSLVIASGQNIDRVISIYKASAQAKKTLVIDPYSAFILERLAEVSPNIPQYDWRGMRLFFYPSQTEILMKNGFEQNVYKYRKSKITKEEIMEGGSELVMLFKDNRYSRMLLEQIPNLENANMIWSLWKGYLQNNNLEAICQEKNINFYCIHTSGHAGISEMKSLIKATNPKIIIPIHTEKPEKYQKYFENVHILTNNQILEV